MINPKEFFRFNVTREKKAPATGAGTAVPPRKDGFDKFLENKAAFENRDRSNSAVAEPPTTIDVKTIDSAVQTAIGITRATPFPPVREKELAPPPTPEEVKAANSGQGLSKTENAVLSFAKRHPLVTAGSATTAVVTGFAAVEAYQGNIPGIHRSIDIPQHFDTNAVEGVIGDNNILRGVSLETIQKMPQFDEKGEPLLLIVTPQAGKVSKFTKELTEGGILPDILANAKARGSKNKMEVDNIGKDTDIPLPIDGYVFLMIVERPGQSIFAGVTVEFMTPNNTLDFVNIGTTDNRRQALVDAPRISPENSNGRDYTKGLFLKRGTPIMRSLIDGNTVDYSRESGENGTLLTNRRIPGNIVPLTTLDTTTGKNKLPAQ